MSAHTDPDDDDVLAEFSMDDEPIPTRPVRYCAAHPDLSFSLHMLAAEIELMGLEDELGLELEPLTAEDEEVVAKSLREFKERRRLEVN